MSRKRRKAQPPQIKIDVTIIDKRTAHLPVSPARRQWIRDVVVATLATVLGGIILEMRPWRSDRRPVDTAITPPAGSSHLTGHAPALHVSAADTVHVTAQLHATVIRRTE